MLLAPSTRRRSPSGARLRETRGAGRQPDPAVHRLFPARRGRHREIGISEAADRYAASRRAAIAFPEYTAAAVGAEMKADLEPAVGDPAVDLVLAFDPHLAFRPEAAVMNDGTGAALAGLAMTDIDAVRLPRRDRPQLSAMTLRDPLHLVLPNVPLRQFPILAVATGGVEPLDPLFGPGRKVVSWRPKPAAQ